jgi:hypothetical protein
MGRISCFGLEGIQCWFNSQEHKPPHFHAKRRGEWEVRVHFLKSRTEMVEVKWQNERISRQDRKNLCDKAKTYRPELLKEWEEKVRYDD